MARLENDCCSAALQGPAAGPLTRSSAAAMTAMRPAAAAREPRTYAKPSARSTPPPRAPREARDGRLLQLRRPARRLRRRAVPRDGRTGGSDQRLARCGVPTAVADLHDGEIVLDLGAGAGADVLIAARRVAPRGRAIARHDRRDARARAAHASDAGAENVEFLKGYLEDIPLPDESVDVVISNCVINLAADKAVVLREAARVLRPGGRLAISDVIADPGMDLATGADVAQWTGCIAGALTREEFAAGLEQAGLTAIEFRETHRVHEHAAATIIRARKDCVLVERLLGPAAK